ncbi:MAG: hypothetical protein JNM07_13580 [Phycisphaerae bacterium]|nr:hypothetical protein [Phycisphaerae bacterium]
MPTESTPAVSAVEFAGRLVDAIVETIRSENAPELRRARELLAQRLAVAGAIPPSRIPAPANITEIGGYLNLLERYQEDELRVQALSSALGVAGRTPPPGWYASGPVRFFVTRPQSWAGASPPGPAFAREFTVRSDFAAPLDAELALIRAQGAAVPIASPVRALTSFGQPLGSAADPLAALGRVLELEPAAALVDPDADPLALARPDSSSPYRVVARQLDSAAPRAGDVAASNWLALACGAGSCSEGGGNRTYLDLTTYLNRAGWFQPVIVLPTSLAAPGSWNRWENRSGLVAGRSLLGDELALVYHPSEIAQSAWRDMLGLRWDGSRFAP